MHVQGSCQPQSESLREWAGCVATDLSSFSLPQGMGLGCGQSPAHPAENSCPRFCMTKTSPAQVQLFQCSHRAQLAEKQAWKVMGPYLTQCNKIPWTTSQLFWWSFLSTMSTAKFKGGSRKTLYSFKTDSQQAFLPWFLPPTLDPCFSQLVIIQTARLPVADSQPNTPVLTIEV